MRKPTTVPQIPKGWHFAESKKSTIQKFRYDLNYSNLNLRQKPYLYRVGLGEQGVLLVEPYKSEILPFWRFKTPIEAKLSSEAVLMRFYFYRRCGDFIGMDMARKFLQMGFTRARRYANHASGRKYDSKGNILPFQKDLIKAESAKIFFEKWKIAEADPIYCLLKAIWRRQIG